MSRFFLPLALIPYKNVKAPPAGSIIVKFESAPINDILFELITTVSLYVPASM